MPPNDKCATYRINGIESNEQNGNQFIIKPRNYIKLTLNIHAIPKLSS
jgi:hypothetical protein